MKKLVDFNGDGTSDILWQNTQTGVVALWQIKNKAITSSQAFGNFSATHTIADLHCDFNGDKKSDMFWGSRSDGKRIEWLMNDTAVSSAVDFGVIPIS
jgi:hypothetical protein